jgi:hypothetical protein
MLHFYCKIRRCSRRCIIKSLIGLVPKQCTRQSFIKHLSSRALNPLSRANFQHLIPATSTAESPESSQHIMVSESDEDSNESLLYTNMTDVPLSMSEVQLLWKCPNFSTTQTNKDKIINDMKI